MLIFSLFDSAGGSIVRSDFLANVFVIFEMLVFNFGGDLFGDFDGLLRYLIYVKILTLMPF